MVYSIVSRLSAYIPNSTKMLPREGKLRHPGTEVANSAMVPVADEDGCWTTATDETGTEPPGSTPAGRTRSTRTRYLKTVWDVSEEMGSVLHRERLQFL